MALTDTFVRQVKHSGAPAGDKYSDGQGMYLLVKGTSKYWRMKGQHRGKLDPILVHRNAIQRKWAINRNGVRCD